MYETSSSSASVYICALVCLVAVGVSVAVALVAARSLRQQREVRAAAAWQRLLAAHQAKPWADVCYVERVYQRARRGAKAVIVWSATGLRQDAWFWQFWPAAGSTLLVMGAGGYGPHNHNPNVLYVESGGVLASAPAGAQQAWLRLQQAGHQPHR